MLLRDFGYTGTVAHNEIVLKFESVTNLAFNFAKENKWCDAIRRLRKAKCNEHVFQQRSFIICLPSHSQWHDTQQLIRTNNANKKTQIKLQVASLLHLLHYLNSAVSLFSLVPSRLLLLLNIMTFQEQKVQLSLRNSQVYASHHQDNNTLTSLNDFPNSHQC